MRTVILLALLTSYPLTVSGGQAASVVMVSKTQEIPRTGFKTWSLFLICNPDWAAVEKSRDLANLYRQFSSFGKAIGDDNVAVWFWERTTPENDPHLGDALDIARSARYCRALDLAPSQSPYVVETAEYPDVEAFPKEHAVFTLGTLSAGELTGKLGELTDQLLLHKPVGDLAPSLWIRLLESSRQTLIGLGCAVKLQVSAGPLTAELRGCGP
jgi:hypothetical protein